MKVQLSRINKLTLDGCYHALGLIAEGRPLKDAIESAEIYQTEIQEEDKRIEIRKKIQESGNSLYQSMGFCKSLQYIAGELMAQNEEYVLNHYGADETIGTVNILKNGFTDNQITFLKDLEKIIKTADYNEILLVVLKKVDEMIIKKVDEMISEVKSQDESTFSLLRDLRQIKTEIKSCGTRPHIILKKKRTDK